ncbi:MAG TPA: hypothetical protein V6D18_11225 [Thermosynechococcaceae cyanobacterium]
MVRFQKSLPWEVQPDEVYVPVLYQGEVVGFCKPEMAQRIADCFNEEDTCRRALQLACYDLIARSGSTKSPQDLMRRYLAKAERPKSGTGAIAVSLKERQRELDLTDEEFARFCDTFRLSREELRNIYVGESIEGNQLSPLARILGLSMDELLQLWKGDD